MMTQQEIVELYREAQPLGVVKLPERLWEGGVSSFLSTVDEIRVNQEKLSGMIIKVAREEFTVQTLLRRLGRMLKSGVVPGQKPWPESIKSYDEIEDLASELAVLLDALKLLHGDLNRARSDLKTKTALLESEAKMGPGGRIDGRESGKTQSAGVSVEKVLDTEVDWEELNP